jgi:chitin synthase
MLHMHALPAYWSCGHLLRAEAHAAKEQHQKGYWASFARGVTCCIPAALLARNGKRGLEVQQAWREKLALCLIIFLMCVMLGFITFGLQALLCGKTTENRFSFNSKYMKSDQFAVQGRWFTLPKNHPDVSVEETGTRDVTPLFLNSVSLSPSCQAKLGKVPEVTECKVGSVSGCHKISYSDLQGYGAGAVVTYEWEDLNKASGYFVIFNGNILNMQSYIDAKSTFLGADLTDIFRGNQGKDITYHVFQSAEAHDRIDCAVALYNTGALSKQTPNCFSAIVISYIMLTVILGLVFARFAMAVIYTWFIGPRRSLAPTGPTYNPPGYNVAQPKSRYTRNMSIANNRSTMMPSVSFVNKKTTAVTAPISKEALNALSNGEDPFTPYVMMMVTCYSEGEEGLRATLESIAETDYNDRRKLFMIVADGLVDSGETDANGEKLTTAQICINMLHLDEENRFPELKSYIAVAEGSKQLNMAKVYAGYFEHNGHAVPVILIVKCGTAQEQNDHKPGNRGKRDSQLILMNFLSKIMFDDRMTPLEYEMFTKITSLTGVTPDFYEMLLMVDADTKVEPKSLTVMVNAMRNDLSVMGVCGETQIANKTASFISAIQVYEYYVSHHLAKAFESVFGGVTCLPGCFSMYRIKAPKGNDGYWVPILANPDVVAEYSQNVVDSKSGLFLLSILIIWD